ncbi:penicillin-binding transpeptidase domain-containing protein [Prosthecochloris ethylica]
MSDEADAMNREEEQRRVNDGGQGPSTKVLSVRLGVVALGYALFFAAIVLRLLNIQVIDQEKYKAKASRQYQRDMVEQAKRGVIYDRHGKLLAQSVQTISFYADPQLVAATPVRSGGRTVDVDKTGEVARHFASALGGSQRHYFRLLDRARKAGRRFVWIERSVPVAEARGLMETRMTGVWFRKEQYRYYLNLAPQVIGLVNTDNEGISGLELVYDDDLRGHDGMKIFQRSATGTKFLAADAEQVEAQAGLSLELTLDADVQSIVEAEVRQVVETFDARAATAIVIDVNTGEVLAMSSYPTFDMNNRSTFKPEFARNRAISDAFDPGSTFKIVMASAATEVLNVAAEDSVDGHGGSLQLFGRTIRDHEKFDRMTFREAMIHSSNIVAAETAMELGAETFYDYVRKFGFGQESGIGLPGESPGILQPVEKWYKTTLPWMGYGYSITATPLQVLQAYAAIANDGVMMKPYIIRRLLDDEGNVVREFGPEKSRTVVSAATARYIRREYLRPIIEEGTGKAAAIAGVPAAGKTGTAQKLLNGNYNRGRRSYIASFAGFFPVENPKIAAIIVVDEPDAAYYASTVAAPSFSKICSRMIAGSEALKKELGLTLPEEEMLQGPAAVTVPLVVGLSMREAKRLLEWSGLEIRYQGDPQSVVVDQGVDVGEMVAPGTVVRVWSEGQEPVEAPDPVPAPGAVAGLDRDGEVL